MASATPDTNEIHPGPQTLSKPQVEMDEQIEKSQEISQAAQWDHLSRRKTIKLFWKPAMFSAMALWGACMEGFNLTMPGNIIANQGFVNQFGTIVGPGGTLALDPYHIAMWGGIQQGATVFALIYAGYLTDWLGRKAGMWLLLIWVLLANVLELVATDYRVWAASKVFTGMSQGFTQAMLLVYVCEIAPTAIRGTLLAVWPFGFCLGQLTASIGLQVLETSANRLDYRRVLYSQFVLSGIFAIFVVLVPETPWFYAMRGKHEHGRKALGKLNGNVAGYDVEQQYGYILAQLEAVRNLQDASRRMKWADMFKGVNGRRFLISAAMPVYAAFVGNNLVFSYTAYFFQIAGVQDPFVGTVAVFVVLLGMVVLSWYTTDRFGRRPLLLGGSSVIVIVLLLLGVLGSIPQNRGTSSGLLALALIWVAGYGTGISPIAPAYQSETSTPELRARTTTVSQAIAQAFTLVFSYCNPLMLNAWGVKTGYFYCGLALLGLVLLYFVMPELKGRSYAELDELFNARIPARKFATTKTSTQLSLERGETHV